MRRPRGVRHESSCELVFALRASLEDTDAAFYAKLKIEIGRRVMRAVRVVVAAREKAPVLVVDFGSCQPPHVHARFLYSPSLLADFLALRGGEAGEKFIETRVTK